MKGDFCRIITSDGLELQGLFVTPEGGTADTSVLHIHGLAGNFYENRFLDHVAQAVASEGMNFLTANTRGHDYISDFICEALEGTKEYRQIGGIYEIFSECTQDITAWVDFLKARGSTRLVLQGHSHGALKAVYYLHKTDEPTVKGLILLSPSDDFGCQRARIGERFDEALEVARQMIDQDNGRELMPGEYFHYPVSAATYFDIFKHDSDLGMFNLAGTDRRQFEEIESIRLPVLVIVGSVEEAFVDTPDGYISDLKMHFRNAKKFTGHVIEGAPHNYLGFDAEVARRIGAWLRSEMSG
jgi:pimeloyl-ACP methyl ester carboxylesterase